MAKINISIPTEILDELDKLSKEKKMTRSELIRKAFKTYVEMLAEKKREQKKKQGIEKAVRLQDEILFHMPTTVGISNLLSLF